MRKITVESGEVPDDLLAWVRDPNRMAVEGYSITFTVVVTDDLAGEVVKLAPTDSVVTDQPWPTPRKRPE